MKTKTTVVIENAHNKSAFVFEASSEQLAVANFKMAFPLLRRDTIFSVPQLEFNLEMGGVKFQQTGVIPV